MNSLEALDELSLMINREKHINSELNKKINDLKQTIKQDLERLEVLEKENQELKEQHEKDFEVLVKQAYLLNNKHIDKPIIELYKLENEKLKKAVTMLYLVAKLYDFEVYNNLDEKDKNLLEEVLCK